MALLRSLLFTCNTTKDTKIPNSDEPNKPDKTSFSGSDTSSNSISSQETSISSWNSSTSLQSNLSIQTLPSVPSLQKTLPETTLNISVSHHCISSFKPQTQQINTISLSGNLLYIASGSEINVFDITNNLNNKKHPFNGNGTGSGSVKSIIFANGKVITAHQDCRIRVWKFTERKHHLVATLPTKRDRFRKFALPKNYVNIRRHNKRLWIEHVDAVSGLAISNGLIYSVSWDRYLKIWRSKDLLCLESIKAHDDAINAVAVSNDGTVYTGSADRRIRVWGRGFNENKKNKHSLIATLEKHKSAVNALALSTDGSVLFSGACDRSILVWEREDSAHYMVVTGALRGHSGAILCLINVGDLLMSGSADRTVRIWRRSGDGSHGYCCLSVLEGHEKAVKSLVAVKDVKEGNGGDSKSDVVRICSGSLDGEVKVWDVVVSSLKKSGSSSISED